MAEPECPVHRNSRKISVGYELIPQLHPTVSEAYGSYSLHPPTAPASLIGMCLTHVHKTHKKAAELLVPIIEERYQLPPEERPNDYLSWLMEDAVGEERAPYNLTLRVLSTNFAAIHTTSMVSLFDLDLAPVVER
jgi:hypothetical protein